MSQALRGAAARSCLCPIRGAAFAIPALHGEWRPISWAARCACQTLAAGGLLLSAGAQAQSTPQADNALPAVTVTADTAQSEALPATYAGGQVAKGARLGALGNVDVMDAPFNVTSYTAQVIADQQAATLADVLRNDPSVRFTTSDGHNSENFTIRGFEINSYDIAFNGMYGLMPKTHVPTEMIERVEIFRGPAGMLSGLSPSGSIGGVINVVPKRAGDKDLTRVTTSVSSKSRLGLAADVSRRFGEEKRLGIRVNGSYSNGKTTLDAQKKEEEFASLGMDYRGDRWKLELDAYAANQSQENGSPLMVGFGSLTRVIKAPKGSVNVLKGTYAAQQSRGAVLRGEYRLDDQWSAYGALGTATYDYMGYINGTRVVLTSLTGAARGQTYHQKGYNNTVSAETGLRGAFRTGSVGHQLTASASLLQIRTGQSAVQNSTAYTTNIYTPSTSNLAAMPSTVRKTGDNEYLGLALSDTLSMLDDKLLLTLGLRHQSVHTDSWNVSTRVLSTYDKNAVTPALGVVFKPWGEGVSLYANYIEGLTPGDTVGTTYANAGEVLAPYKSKQAEVGVKWEAGGFTNTFDLFQISKATGVANASNYYVADGEQQHRGVEWNTFGQIIPGVRILGGAAYTHAEMTKVAATSSLKGKTPYGVPEWTANLGAEWDIPWVPGLTANARVIYTGKQYLNSTNTLELPSWARLDLGARYSLRVSDKPVALRASVENATNRAYWAGTFNDGYATIGAPRTFKLSATVDF